MRAFSAHGYPLLFLIHSGIRGAFGIPDPERPRVACGRIADAPRAARLSHLENCSLLYLHGQELLYETTLLQWYKAVGSL